MQHNRESMSAKQHIYKHIMQHLGDAFSSALSAPLDCQHYYISTFKLASWLEMLENVV